MRISNNIFRILFKLDSIANKSSYVTTTQLGHLTKHKSRKQNYPSASRNSQPISEALCSQVDKNTPGLQLLEIASGSGQHAAFLARLLPNITFQPTEVERNLFESISEYAEECKTKNILKPLYVDITKDPAEWIETPLKLGSYDYIFNSNMMHISPWACSVGLFNAAGKLLKPQGLLFTYGPYAVDGVLQPESNVNFNLSLKSRNPDWGVRDIADLKILAEKNGLKLKQINEMPSNNKFLTWIKT